MPYELQVAIRYLVARRRQAFISLIGIAFLLRARGNASIRALAWMFPIVVAVMIAGNSKPYYLSPIYFSLVGPGRSPQVRSWSSVWWRCPSPFPSCPSIGSSAMSRRST